MKHFIKLYNYFLTKEYVHLYRECCLLKTLAQKEADLQGKILITKCILFNVEEVMHSMN